MFWGQMKSEVAECGIRLNWPGQVRYRGTGIIRVSIRGLSWRKKKPLHLIAWYPLLHIYQAENWRNKNMCLTFFFFLAFLLLWFFKSLTGMCYKTATREVIWNLWLALFNVLWSFQDHASIIVNTCIKLM